VIVYVVIDVRSSSDHPLGVALETFLRREDAERFVEEVRGDDPELASYLRIEGARVRAGQAELAARACSGTCRAYLRSLATARGPIRGLGTRRRFRRRTPPPWAYLVARLLERSPGPRGRR
jgi:hypothetical protein